MTGSLPATRSVMHRRSVSDVEIVPSETVPVRRVLGPGAASSGLVSGKLQGAIRSRTFTIEKSHILYRARGNGVRINVIIDGFQQISDPIYGGLTFTVNDSKPRWYMQNVTMWVGQRAYIEVLDDGPGHIELERILFSDTGPPPDSLNPRFIKLIEDVALKTPEDLAQAYQKLLRGTVKAWREGKLAGLEDAADRVDLLNFVLTSKLIAALPGPREVGADRGFLAKKLEAIASVEAALPLPRRGLALAEGTGVNERVSIRGNHKTPGEEAPRQLPVVLADDRTKPPAGSGRREMAIRLTSPDNPLLARVLVNRLWHHHFGSRHRAQCR